MTFCCSAPTGSPSTGDAEIESVLRRNQQVTARRWTWRGPGRQQQPHRGGYKASRVANPAHRFPATPADTSQRYVPVPGEYRDRIHVPGTRIRDALNPPDHLTRLVASTDSVAIGHQQSPVGQFLGCSKLGRAAGLAACDQADRSPQYPPGGAPPGRLRVAHVVETAAHSSDRTRAGGRTGMGCRNELVGTPIRQRTAPVVVDRRDFVQPGTRRGASASSASALPWVQFTFAPV
jgi:hypothetical protein